MEAPAEEIADVTSNNSNSNSIISYQLPITSIEDVPAYCSRFSLCVLDVIRKLQQIPSFEKGVEKCYIVEYLRHLPNMDGDILSQVSIALRDLECNGYLMHLKNGYKTIGPFAKLCMAKTLRQRKILWRKFDMKFNHSYTDLTTVVSSTGMLSQAKKCRRTRSETNLLIDQNNSLKDYD